MIQRVNIYIVFQQQPPLSNQIVEHQERGKILHWNKSSPEFSQELQLLDIQIILA